MGGGIFSRGGDFLFEFLILFFGRIFLDVLFSIINASLPVAFTWGFFFLLFAAPTLYMWHKGIRTRSYEVALGLTILLGLATVVAFGTLLFAV